MSDHIGPVLVLREGVHGMPVEGYAAALRERLDCEVRLARTPAQERELVTNARVVTDGEGGRRRPSPVEAPLVPDLR